MLGHNVAKRMVTIAPAQRDEVVVLKELEAEAKSHLAWNLSGPVSISLVVFRKEQTSKSAKAGQEDAIGGRQK